MANKRTITNDNPMNPMKGEIIKVGPLTLSLETRYLVVDDGEPVYLRPKEFEVCRLLMQRPNEVLHREVIWNTVWETDPLNDFRSLYVHACWLRKKIGANPHCRLRTVRGVGYWLDVDAKPCYNSTQQQDTSCCGNREDTETS